MAKAKRLPSGSYRVLLYIGTDPAGKRQYKSFTAETAKEAERQAALYEVDSYVDHSTMTLSAACKAYIDNRSHVLSPWTVTTYNKYIIRDILPIAETRVDRLTQDMLQRFVSDFALKKHTPVVSTLHFISVG